MFNLSLRLLFCCIICTSVLVGCGSDEVTDDGAMDVLIGSDGGECGDGAGRLIDGECDYNWNKLELESDDGSEKIIYEEKVIIDDSEKGEILEDLDETDKKQLDNTIDLTDTAIPYTDESKELDDKFGKDVGGWLDETNNTEADTE